MFGKLPSVSFVHPFHHLTLSLSSLPSQPPRRRTWILFTFKGTDCLVRPIKCSIWFWLLSYETVESIIICFIAMAKKWDWILWCNTQISVHCYSWCWIVPQDSGGESLKAFSECHFHWRHWSCYWKVLVLCSLSGLIYRCPDCMYIPSYHFLILEPLTPWSISSWKIKRTTRLWCALWRERDTRATQIIPIVSILWSSFRLSPLWYSSRMERRLAVAWNVSAEMRMPCMLLWTSCFVLFVWIGSRPF